jgi:hypothetical protein
VGAKRTDFDKGAYNRPFEKVGPIFYFVEKWEIARK